MPSASNKEAAQDSGKTCIYKKYEVGRGVFADFETRLKFPETVLTSKIVSITESDSFAVSCLKGQPLAMIKDDKIHYPSVGKNNQIPMKPIQRIKAVAENSGSVAIFHGNQCFELDRLAGADSEHLEIVRLHQKSVDLPYFKLKFKDENELLASANSKLDLFDFQRFQCLGSYLANSDISDFDVCPQNPTVVGLLSGSLNVLDTRASFSSASVVFKQTCKSRMMKWNPRIPYWVATATEKGLDVFDIRYNGSSPMVTINHSNVKEFCWSASNCDLILASSKDRRINLWSLGYAAEHCRLNLSKSESEFESLVASNCESHLFYGLDNTGRLLNIRINPSYLNTIAPHQSHEKDFQEAEEALYSADLNAFKSKLAQASQEAVNGSGYDKMKQLLEMAAPLTSSSNFEVSLVSSIKNDDNKQAFEELLRKDSASNIQNLVKSRNSSLENLSELNEFIDTLKLKVKAAELLIANDYEGITLLQDLLLKAYKEDAEFLDKNQSIKLMALLLNQNRKNSIGFLLELNSFYSFERPDILQTWLWMVCYPTVFDTRSFELLKARQSLSRTIEDVNATDKTSVTLEQIRQSLFSCLLADSFLGFQTQKIVNQIAANISNNQFTHKQLLNTEIRLLEDGEDRTEFLDSIQTLLIGGDGSSKLMSAELVKCLLERNLKTSRLQEFFLIAFRLILLTSKTPMGAGTKDYVIRFGFPRLKLYLNQACIHAPEKALLLVVNLVSDDYFAFSEDQCGYLGNILAMCSEQHEAVSKSESFATLKELFHGGPMKRILAGDTAKYSVDMVKELSGLMEKFSK